jgi:hypothetical protein
LRDALLRHAQGTPRPAGQSLAKILVHAVFSTHDLRPFLRDRALREELRRYLGGILTNRDGQPMIVALRLFGMAAQPATENADDADGHFRMFGHQFIEFGVAHSQEQGRFCDRHGGHARLGIERGQFSENFTRPQRRDGFRLIFIALRLTIEGNYALGCASS